MKQEIFNAHASSQAKKLVFSFYFLILFYEKEGSFLMVIFLSFGGMVEKIQEDWTTLQTTGRGDV